MSETHRFTPFEELMFYQDSRAYPCTCFVRMQFHGVLERQSFTRAARRALTRHPLLGAKVTLRRGKPHWLLSPDGEPVIHWQEAEVNQASPSTSWLDLVGEGGLRLIVVVDATRSDLLVQFHHACCDGVGIFQFILDLLIAYANEAGATPGSYRFPKLDPERLRQRGSLGLTSKKLLKMVPQQMIGLQGVRQFVMRTPRPIVPHQRWPNDTPAHDVYPALCADQFDADTTQGLRASAKQLGVTVNDLLARDLFLALHQFRTGRALGQPEDWLRMMIPMNLRSVADRHLPAANIVSSVFLDRRGSDFTDGESLLASIKEQMDLIKRLQLGFTFIFSLYANRLLPGGLRRVGAGTNCNTSVVFTNLGKLFARTPLPKDQGRLVAANVRLDRIAIAAPLAPYLCASFAAGWYADRLTLTLHHDPRVLDAPSAQQLLQCFVEQVRTSARTAAPPTPSAQMAPAPSVSAR